MTKKSNQKNFLDAMHKTFGNITQSCKIAGIDRSNPYKWAEEDEEFSKKFNSDDWGELKLDFVESQLLQQIRAGIPSSTIFFLKTKGIKRGYLEHQKIEHDTSEPIELIIVNAKDKDK